MINVDLIEEHINENTRAIIPVHIGGAAADMPIMPYRTLRVSIPAWYD